MKLNFAAIISASACLLCSCAGRQAVTVQVTNNTGADGDRIIELDARDMLARLDARHCFVTAADGTEIPSQITSDSLLLFRAELQSGASADFRINACDSAHTYAPTVSGRAYPERADDIAWENESGGYRIYGPTTQARGERAFGYDIFFKHYTEEPVLERLYEPETNPRTWQIVDSLRAIDPALADEFIKSFSYHIDHGLGMDCYAVGPTLGAGVAAPVDGDSLNFAWCYSSAEVLDNGPLRFTVALDFAPRAIGADSLVTEHRIISLDSRSPLNRCRVIYEGLTAPVEVAAGFPRRDESEARLDAERGVVAYSDPTQGPDNGRAYLGLVAPGGLGTTYERYGHILGSQTVQPADTLEYFWGFEWDRNNPRLDIDCWKARLDAFAEARRQPFTVSITD